MAIGIDFGTTNSVVARWSAGGMEVLSIDEPPGVWSGLGFDRVLPTVFGRGDDDAPIFGWAAKQRPGSLAAVKRLLRAEEHAEVDGVEYSVEEIATMIFGHLKRASTSQGAPFDSAVVTIPANSRGIARHRTKVCAGMAGIQVQALVNEPTAAAMAYSLRATHEETLMVVDWGGGTLDVTILRNVDGVFMEKASKGIQQLGGLDLDTALSRLVLDTVGDNSGWSPSDRAGFRLDIEKAKIELSSTEMVNVPLPGGQYRQVTRHQFEQAIRDQIERVGHPIAQCLGDLGWQPSDIDAVVLVGGTCKIPAIRAFVTDLLGKAPVPGIDPMTAVAEGASIASAILANELDSLDFFVSTEHALGTVTVDPFRGALEFSQLIPRNHKLPARATKSFVPVTDYQEGLEIQVVEGDPSVSLEHQDNVIIKTWDVELPDPRPMGEVQIDVSFTYDVDGILHVTATDDLGNQLLEEDVSYGLAVDRRKLVEIAERTNRALDDQRLDRSAPVGANSEEQVTSQVRQLITNVRTKIVPFIGEDEANELGELVEKAAAGDAAAAQELELKSKTYSYLL